MPVMRWKMRSLCWLFAILASVFATAPRALAWGDAGHRIICQLAYLELTPAPKAKVDALMALDPKFHTFASGCTWPDVFPPVRPPEHFLNVTRTAKAVDPAAICPSADRCVASAILNDTAELAKRPGSSDQLRLLKSIGHWVGDIHQPLHVSFEDDKGGNLIKVSGQCSYSLHLVWDVCIIHSEIGEDEAAIAATLRNEITESDRKAWTPESLDVTAVAAWATESLVIAESPSVQYCTWREEACWYSETEEKFDGHQRTVEITPQYLREQAPIVRERFKRAGIRLAAVLNMIFAQ